MGIQEMDIGFVRQVSLDFYAKIEIRLGDGTQQTLWERNLDDPSALEGPEAVLLFTSEQPISKSEFNHVVETLKIRLDDGWHHGIT